MSASRTLFLFLGLTALMNPAFGDERLALKRAHPDVSFLELAPGRMAVFGCEMTPAATPSLATQRWWDHYSNVLGNSALELVEQRISEIQGGRFTVFAYTQTLDGIPVEGSVIRVIVRNEPKGSAVVLVSADISPLAPTFVEPTIASDSLVRLVESSDYGYFEKYSDPELIWHRGANLTLCWSFLAHRRVGAYETMRFSIDASTGAVIEARDALYYNDVAGTVTGQGSPGLLPNVSYNQPVSLPVPGAIVDVSGITADTDTNGNYLATLGSPGAATASVSTNGLWVNVRDDATGTALMASMTGTAPGTINLELNALPTDAGTDQVNCFVHVTGAHDFLKSYDPGLTVIDAGPGCVVNLPFPGIAAFDPMSNEMIFGIGGTFFDPFSGQSITLTSLAYSTIVVHEYGHFVHLALGLTDQAFGEGYADTLSLMVFNDSVSGADFMGPGTFGRDAATADKQYPCSDPDPHVCGQLLAGVWWDIKEALEVDLGTALGLETARQLFVDWSSVTSGGMGDNSAHPMTAVEILTLDDNDGNLANGTPNYAAICAGFDLHSIDCPVIQTTPEFQRGDANNDGSFNLSDAVVSLTYLFLSGSVDCLDALDVDDNGTVNLPDPVLALNYLFTNGAPPANPFPSCGTDTTPDVNGDLGCLATVCP